MKRDRLYFSFLCLCCFLFCALDVQAQQDYWKGQVKDIRIRTFIMVFRHQITNHLPYIPCFILGSFPHRRGFCEAKYTELLS